MKIRDIFHMIKPSIRNELSLNMRTFAIPIRFSLWLNLAHQTRNEERIRKREGKNTRRKESTRQELGGGGDIGEREKINKTKGNQSRYKEDTEAKQKRKKK